MDNDIANINCQIISHVGAAKSSFIEAIDLALEGNIDEAKQLVKDGKKEFNEGHKLHGQLLTAMANGEDIKMDLLGVHAQCQMMSAEDFLVIAQKVIRNVKK